MMKVSSSVVINKPVAEVFAYATDPDKTTNWQGGLDKVIHEGPTNAVGAHWTEVRKFMGQEMKSQMEVTAFDPNARWGVKVVKGPVPFEVVTTFQQEGSGTRMTTELEGEPTGFFKMAEGVLKGQMQQTLDENGQRLKKVLEG